MKKKAIITGTTSGLGYYIATYYHNNGFMTLGANRRKVELAPPIDGMLYFDLSEICEIQNFVRYLVEQYETIDVLVNNAGVMHLNDFEAEDYDTIPVNFEGPMILCKEVINQGLLQHGHIINIASVSGMVGDIDAPIYSACKAGVINLTRSLAKACAPNIRVNCISPGFFNTNLVEGDAPQELIDKVPMKREAKPEEIVPVIAMLQNSTYITGANIVIDGGLSL